MLYGYKILVYCTSQISKTSFNEFISTFNEELVAHGWRVLVFCSESDLGKDNKNKRGNMNIYDLINYDIADAVLISDERIQDKSLKNKIIKNSKAHNLPVFVFDGDAPDTYNVKFDQKHSFMKVVKHIVEQHEITSLHFLAGTRDSIQSQLRLEGFKEVLKANNIPFDNSMVSYGDFWDGPTVKVIQRLIDENRVPRAIICANDTMAIATIRVLSKNGFVCPRDVIVTGFDGIDSIMYSTPKVTSIYCNFHTLAQETAHFIFEVSGKNIEPCTRLVDGTLLISESCGCESITPSNALDCITTLSNSYARFRNENINLSEITSLIHDSQDIEEVMANLKNDLLYNCMCIVKAECVDNTVDPNKSQTKTTYGEDLFVLLDSDFETAPDNRYIKTKDLIPRMSDILDYYKKPLIFTPLNNIDMPLGYLMFCFCNYDKQNFAKVNQIAAWLSNAISAFRNAQYQKELQKKIENMYSHDSLTELYNRNGFLRIYNKLLEDPDIKEISLAMCDLDNLKYINDNFSHTEGDNAIRVVGKALSSVLPEGYFARYGGDEIIGLYTSRIDSEDLQKKLEIFIDDYNKNSNKPYKVSTSIGVYSSGKTSFEEMFAKADELMYKQKLSKKNRRQ